MFGLYPNEYQTMVNTGITKKNRNRAQAGIARLHRGVRRRRRRRVTSPALAISAIGSLRSLRYPGGQAPAAAFALSQMSTIFVWAEFTAPASIVATWVSSKNTMSR